MSSATQFNDGSAYERVMGRWSRLVGRKFLGWAGTPPDLDWLDVGCGNGAFTEEIIRHAAPRSIVGIDPSPGQLDFARGRESAASATFVLGDAENLPVADRSVDVSTMGLVIAFVPNPERALSEMRRVTRPGGVIHTYMWDLVARKSPMAPLQRALREMDLAASSPVSSEVTSQERLEQLWHSAGLVEIESTRIPLEVRFESFADFFGSATLPSGPQADRLRNLTPDQRAELEARLRQTVPEASDGSVSYEAVANAVRGRVP